MVGRVSRAYLRRSLSSPPCACGAVQRHRALVSGDHLRGPFGIEVAAGGARRRRRVQLRRGHRPILGLGDLRQTFALAPLWSFTSISAMRFNSGFFSCGSASRADWISLRAALGGLLDEGDVVDRLADRRPSAGASTAAAWLASISAAISGTSEALPAVMVSQRRQARRRSGALRAAAALGLVGHD